MIRRLPRLPLLPFSCLRSVLAFYFNVSFLYVSSPPPPSLSVCLPFSLYLFPFPIPPNYHSLLSLNSPPSPSSLIPPLGAWSQVPPQRPSLAPIKGQNSGELAPTPCHVTSHRPPGAVVAVTGLTQVFTFCGPGDVPFRSGLIEWTKAVGSWRSCSNNGLRLRRSIILWYPQVIVAWHARHKPEFVSWQRPVILVVWYSSVSLIRS